MAPLASKEIYAMYLVSIYHSLYSFNKYHLVPILCCCFVKGTGEEWLDAINEVREEYQVEYGGPYTPVKWSVDLANAAQQWANEISARCMNGIPGATTNPEDFGVATILNMRNPQLAVDRWVMNGELSIRIL